MAKRKSALNLPHPVLNTGCHNRHATIDLATQNIYIAFPLQNLQLINFDLRNLKNLKNGKISKILRKGLQLVFHMLKRV